MLTTDGALGEVELFATVQFIDLIKMPDSAKISGLVAIMGMKSQEDNEWMYELESSQLNNPFRVSNAIYKKLLAGSSPDSPEVRDLVAALQLEHEEQLQSQSHATHVNESPDAKSSGCAGNAATPDATVRPRPLLPLGAKNAMGMLLHRNPTNCTVPASDNCTAASGWSVILGTQSSSSV